MTNIKHFESKETIQQQACEWISKIDRGLSVQDRVEFSLWVGTSKNHQSILFELCETWDELSVLNELKGLFPSQNQKILPTRKVFSDKVRGGMAASIAFVFFSCVGLAVNHQIELADEAAETLLTLETQTAIGEQKTLNLADGSVIHLNTNTVVQVDYSQSHRHIKLLQGEAHFDVAHDVLRPFIVDTGKRSVTAVGTAFNIQVVSDKKLELLVTEGKVLVKNELLGGVILGAEGQENLARLTEQDSVSADGQLLIAGQKSIFGLQTVDNTTLSEEQIQNELAWQQGMLVFHGESLGDALLEISRYTSVTFEMMDDNVKEQRVAGYFKAGDIDGLLFALKNNFNITYSKTSQDTIALSSNEE